MEKKSKTVKMNAGQDSKPEKLSYEQLEKIANSLNGECKKLYAQLQEAQGLIANFNDVGMLLSIIREGENFDSAFIDRCARKVQDIVTRMLDNADENEKEAEK